jgi:hypothetical protein
MGVAAGAVLTVVATSMITWLISTSSAGVDAAERVRIKSVIDEELLLDDGRSYGQAISSLDKNYAVLAGGVVNQAENLDLMRRALERIAEDQDDGG